MRYTLTPIHCRPWTLNGLSLKLIESHYENNYGGALRRLNAISASLEALDVATAPAYVVNGLKRDELVAPNSTLVVPPRPLLLQPEFGDLAGVSVEEVRAMLDRGEPVQIVDARPRHDVSRTQDIMEGATWRAIGGKTRAYG